MKENNKKDLKLEKEKDNKEEKILKSKKERAEKKKIDREIMRVKRIKNLERELSFLEAFLDPELFKIY